MRVTLAQLNPKVGDFKANLAKAEKTLGEALTQEPDLVVFPELYLTGYPPQDLLERNWFIERQNQTLSRLAQVTNNYPDTGVIVGAALPSRLETGRGLFNTAVLLYRGEMIFSQAKSLLPTYDVFDETRYFDPAVNIETFLFKDCRLGISVCEDAWNHPDFWRGRLLYSIDPIEMLARQKPDLLINISGSPFFRGKDQLRYRLIRHHAIRHGLPFVFVNQVGGNDELIFDGRSLCLDKNGDPLLICPPFVEYVSTVDTAQKGIPSSFTPQNEIESVHQALILGIRDYLGKSGFKTAVVGLSGGIDSAVTFALAVEALGRENVLGISMPSMYSSVGSVQDSKLLAANTGAELKVIPIKDIYDQYISDLSSHFQNKESDVTEENIQARIRGNILMAFSNKFGHLVLATGNKSELAMGYCTLYGDMSGGLAVLSDLPKTMVYELAAFINRDREIIPLDTIGKPPSAELRPGQKDEDSLPPYAILDQVLSLYIEEGLAVEEIVARGFEPEMVTWVVKAVNKNEYKRKQAPGGLKVTTKAFGQGRRMPIVARHDL